MKKCKMCKQKLGPELFTISKDACDPCMTERLVLIKERVELFALKKSYGLGLEPDREESGGQEGEDVYT